LTLLRVLPLAAGLRRCLEVPFPTAGLPPCLVLRRMYTSSPSVSSFFLSIADSCRSLFHPRSSPGSPFLGGYQQAFNPLSLPYINLPFYPSAQASYFMQAQQQSALNGLRVGGGQNFASFPSSTATSATSSTFGPTIGLGLTHPASNQHKLATAGGLEEDSWSRINW